MKNGIILTCEHAGNSTPEGYSELFKGNEHTLNSHRGWDPGALELAEKMATKLNAPLFYASVTRLLIEFNRSLDNVELYSEFSSHLDEEKKLFLLNAYHQYRKKAVDKINELLESCDRVIHISVHTFTPVWKGVERTADVGILFDPARKSEADFSEKWKKAIAEAANWLTIKYNYPYRGIDDGFVVYLRKKFDQRYTGIELEVNQKHVNGEKWQEINKALVVSLKNLLEETD